MIRVVSTLLLRVYPPQKKKGKIFFFFNCHLCVSHLNHANHKENSRSEVCLGPGPGAHTQRRLQKAPGSVRAHRAGRACSGAPGPGSPPPRDPPGECHLRFWGACFPHAASAGRTPRYKLPFWFWESSLSTSPTLDLFFFLLQHKVGLEINRRHHSYFASSWGYAELPQFPQPSSSVSTAGLDVPRDF